MIIERIYDKDLSQAAWLIGCQTTKEALIVDPERDVSRYIEKAKIEGLHITAIAETHIHADFLSGAHELAMLTDATVYLSNHGGGDWSYTWPKNSNVSTQLVSDCDTFTVGNITVTIIHTPGHTPEHICFLIHDENNTDPIGVLTGDFVFVGDLGRPDLLETAAGFKGVMEESAAQLYTSSLQFISMEDYIQVWPCHGAGSACGKALGAIPQSTVGYEKRTSPPLQLLGCEQEFVDYMLFDQSEPPLYFARMKRLNRDGYQLLGGLPKPKKITEPEELVEIATHATVIDTRPWDEVCDGHLPDSIWSQANNDFHRFAGSFITEEEEIVFIVSEENLERAIRNSIRIGLDKIVAWAEPSTLLQILNLDTMPEISVEQFEQLHSAYIIDVRRSSEFNAGHINEAVNMPHTRLIDQLDVLDLNKKYVVHCQGGHRSAAACMVLRKNGFHVCNLAGGFARWKKYKERCAVTQ